MMGAVPLDHWPYLSVLAPSLLSMLGPYLGVFVVLIACSLGLPIPEDVPLLMAGFMCYEELAHVWIMIPVAMVGVLAGDFVLYGLGRKFGHHIVEHRFVRRLVNPSRLLAAERLFQRHGLKIIFVGRFLPGLRPMIFVASGVLRVPFLLFAGINGFAACISVPTIILLGRYFGHNLDRIQRDVRVVSHALVLAAVVGVLVIIGVYLHRRQRAIMQDTGVPEEVPPEVLPHVPPGDAATAEALADPPERQHPERRRADSPSEA